MSVDDAMFDASMMGEYLADGEQLPLMDSSQSLAMEASVACFFKVIPGVRFASCFESSRYRLIGANQLLPGRASPISSVRLFA
jgi:hypothetical protein